MSNILLAAASYFAPYLISDEPDFACWVTAILALLLGGTVAAVLAAAGIIGFFRFLRLKKMGSKEIKERVKDIKEKLVSKIHDFASSGKEER